MKTSTCTAGSRTHNRQWELGPLDRAPGAVQIAEQSKLLLKDAATAIPSAVVVPQDHGYGKGKPRDPARQPQIPISEITNEENSIGLELLQQLFISVAPGAVQITGNGETQVLQSECLGCIHPARIGPDER